MTHRTAWSSSVAAAAIAGLCGCSSSPADSARGAASSSAGDASSRSAPARSANDAAVDAAGKDASAPDHLGSSAPPTPRPADAGSHSIADAGSAAAPSSSAADGGASPFKGVANSACTDLVRLGASWYYNWTQSPGSCTASRFVPMVWGHTGTEQSASGIAGEVASAASAGYDTVLGFNEPDNSSQSNISVATAIALWPSFNHAGIRLGSPATQGNSTGLTWIKSFLSQVDADTTGTLRVDFIAAHWYGWNAGSCDAKAAGLDSYLRQLEAIPGNRPIWLTEWGCLNQSNPDAATVQAFFTGALAVFAKHPRLERYAWYPWTTNNELVDSDGGALTSLGMAFAAAPATK